MFDARRREMSTSGLPPKQRTSNDGRDSTPVVAHRARISLQEAVLRAWTRALLTAAASEATRRRRARLAGRSVATTFATISVARETAADRAPTHPIGSPGDVASVVAGRFTSRTDQRSPASR